MVKKSPIKSTNAPPPMDEQNVVAKNYDEMELAEKVDYLHTQIDGLKSYLQNKFQHDKI